MHHIFIYSHIRTYIHTHMYIYSGKIHQSVGLTNINMEEGAGGEGSTSADLARWSLEATEDVKEGTVCVCVCVYVYMCNHLWVLYCLASYFLFFIFTH
jgi:hypothetical protein